MIGLSLSLCIKDIIEGRVRECDVDCIIAATKAGNNEEWQAVIDEYKKTYWRDNPTYGEKVAWGFILNDKVYQPRLVGEDVHNIANGWWIGTSA